ncbi:molecular chaperone [Shewanella chilikensis]|uniref:TorD/DmsD family molecular chaperone n=1 Tax=Shewanella chilikensis TaxID=558541 RepID=UPI00399B774E
MTSEDNKWIISAAMFNWLADIFYQIPTAEKLVLVKESLVDWPILSKDPSVHVNTILASIEADGQGEINQDFHRLFIGPGKKEVYPWGSIYTDEEKLLFGPSTFLWKEFCFENNLDIQPESNEPTDHFALFFYGLAAIMLSEYDDEKKSFIVSKILKVHFHPWGKTVLELIEQKAQTGYFKGFALLAKDLVEHWS